MNEKNDRVVLTLNAINQQEARLALCIVRRLLNEYDGKSPVHEQVVVTNEGNVNTVKMEEA